MAPTSKSNSSNWLRQAAGALGASGVALGALGAHALKDTLAQRGMTANWQMASFYHLLHATAILGLSTAEVSDSTTDLAGKMLTAGTLLFSGSIYCLSLNLGPKAVFGPTTPIGGLLLLGGWAVVGLGGMARPQQGSPP